MPFKSPICKRTGTQQIFVNHVSFIFGHFSFAIYFPGLAIYSLAYIQNFILNASEFHTCTWHSITGDVEGALFFSQLKNAKVNLYIICKILKNNVIPHSKSFFPLIDFYHSGRYPMHTPEGQIMIELC